jgi:hypothetical protein
MHASTMSAVAINAYTIDDEPGVGRTILVTARSNGNSCCHAAIVNLAARSRMRVLIRAVSELRASP